MRITIICDTPLEMEGEPKMVTAAKTASQVGVHMVVAFTTLYVLTGSIAFGGIAAVVEPICNVIIMPFHEKLWERIRRRIDARRSERKEMAPTMAAQAA
jgi:uncharacterized membrane protein